MDPNATLTLIRDLTDLIEKNEGRPNVVARLAADLAEAVSNLDQWLSRGGFRPNDWLGAGAEVPAGHFHMIP